MTILASVALAHWIIMAGFTTASTGLMMTSGQETSRRRTSRHLGYMAAVAGGQAVAYMVANKASSGHGITAGLWGIPLVLVALALGFSHSGPIHAVLLMAAGTPAARYFRAEGAANTIAGGVTLTATLMGPVQYAICTLTRHTDTPTARTRTTVAGASAALHLYLTTASVLWRPLAGETRP